MKICIAGFGSIGRRHLRNLLAIGEKDIVLFRTHQGTLPEDEISNIPVETDFQKVLDQKPDALFVANPTALHMQVAIPAAKQGCHIFMEKPISHELEQVKELIAVSEASGAKTFVGFQFRFHPGLDMISNLLKENAIGQVVNFTCRWGEYLPAWHPWEDYRKSYTARKDLGGGVVNTLSHPLDYLAWLFGKVDAVQAYIQHISPLELEVEDTADAILQYENGLSGTAHLDYLQRPPQHTLEIVGMEGTMRWNNADGHVQLYQVSKESWETLKIADNFDRNELFLSEMHHFLSVCRGEVEPSCTLNDGILAQQLALAIHKSSNEGRKVALSEILTL
ncbi:MAG: Gfo/Idh/MocA family oxidoreductase [Anaerolineaceae bacterium]|nr:Gfo/Idh/MocA family oxidoreductase [Anaerolineaceae bacterium]